MSRRSLYTLCVFAAATVAAGVGLSAQGRADFIGYTGACRDAGPVFGQAATGQGPPMSTAAIHFVEPSSCGFASYLNRRRCRPGRRKPQSSR